MTRAPATHLSATGDTENRRQQFRLDFNLLEHSILPKLRNDLSGNFIQRLKSLNFPAQLNCEIARQPLDAAPIAEVQRDVVSRGAMTIGSKEVFSCASPIAVTSPDQEPAIALASSNDKKPLLIGNPAIAALVAVLGGFPLAMSSALFAATVVKLICSKSVANAEVFSDLVAAGAVLHLAQMLANPGG